MNKELRALLAGELDRPENRRRVSQQSAAENSNAARVDSLTQAGRNLVEQATRNDEFDAARLESWATMLQTLKDIAANRMPSVADLLKQSAGAGGKTVANSPAKPGDSAGPQKPGEGKPAESPSPGAESKSAPSVSKGGQMAGAEKPGAPQDPNSPPKPAAPSIADREPGFSKPPEAEPADPNAKPKPPGGGKLTLPNTTLAAAPAKKKDDQEPAAPETPAQEKLDTAVTEQKDLLAEFAKVADQLDDIMASLEASTFVKRFKKASREQMTIASTINQKTLDAFGLGNTPPKAGPPLATAAKEQSDFVQLIQSDLDAYFQRKQDSRFKTILDEMKKTEIVRALGRGGEKLLANLSGQAMAGSEYWADMLDRWSEELVAASNCKSCTSCSGDSLPAEIVLKVMQALRDEMMLRDETREMENARPSLEADKYASDARVLGGKQAGIADHTQSAVDDILALPEGAQKFPKELRLLQQVTSVMGEARGILEMPETGAQAIAAETEAIELLLQAKRMSPKGGGGGGSNAGGNDSAQSATAAALSDLGPGSDAAANIAARAVGQATGRAGREFPAELKAGLEAYFNLLESQPSR
jgi:hypothetical protein